MSGLDSRLRVLFLTLYPESMPSSRLRVYQYLPLLADFNIDAQVLPTLSNPWFSKVYYSKSKVMRLLHYISEFLNVFVRVVRARGYDLVVVQKGLLLSNLRGFESLLCWLNPKVIFDIDDAVYGKNVMESRWSFIRMMQDEQQTAKLSKRCRTVIVGNEYLKQQALGYNSQVRVVPTPVDTERIVPKRDTSSDDRELVIGWLGIGSGLANLRIVQQAIEVLAKKYPVRLKVVTLLHGHNFSLGEVPVEVADWKLEEEVEQLQSFDIAVSPLSDGLWEKGKCSLKLLQYMAAGLPTVSSAVGMNLEVVQDGENGFLAKSSEDWTEKLEKLLTSQALRLEMGKKARETVVENYSLKKTSESLAKVMLEVGAS